MNTCFPLLKTTGEETPGFSQGPPAHTKCFFVPLRTGQRSIPVHRGLRTTSLTLQPLLCRERPAVNAGPESHLLGDTGSLSRGERRACLWRMCWREGDAGGTRGTVHLCPEPNNRADSLKHVHCLNTAQKHGPHRGISEGLDETSNICFSY